MPSVSVNPPGEVVEGSKVTLTCSSDANPPVDTYTWYRDRGSSVISTGPQLVKDNVSPADSGQYTCQGTNKHGSQTSSLHTLNVQCKLTKPFGFQISSTFLCRQQNIYPTGFTMLLSDKLHYLVY